MRLTKRKTWYTPYTCVRSELLSNMNTMVFNQHCCSYRSFGLTILFLSSENVLLLPSYICHKIFVFTYCLVFVCLSVCLFVCLSACLYVAVLKTACSCFFCTKYNIPIPHKKLFKASFCVWHMCSMFFPINSTEQFFHRENARYVKNILRKNIQIFVKL